MDAGGCDVELEFHGEMLGDEVKLESCWELSVDSFHVQDHIARRISMTCGIACTLISNCLERNRRTITFKFELPDLHISSFEEVVEDIIQYNSLAMR